jgi:arylsulfatase
MIYDLGSDPGERNALFADKMDNGWIAELVFPFAGEYQKSIAEYPNIKPGEEFTGYPKPIASAVGSGLKK